MGYLELKPNAVYKNGILQASGAPIWQDGDDATSVNITVTSAGIDSRAFGWLDASTLDPADVTAISIVARYKAETTEGVDDFPIIAYIAWANPGGGSSPPFTDVIAPRFVHSQPVINEDEWFLGDDDYAFLGNDMATVASRLTRAPVGDTLRDGQRAVLFDFLVGDLEPPASGTRSYTVYESAVRLYFNDEVLVTRLWPRDDALGLGSANRLVPPPRANRVVGRQP